MKIENRENLTENAIENMLKDTGWQDAVKAITMPEEVKETLIQRAVQTKSGIFRRIRYAKLIPALCMAAILATTGVTAHAVYINTHIRIFVEYDITEEELAALEEKVKALEGIFSCRYVDGSAAWKEFSETYLTPELVEGFTENPLADCANLEAGILLQADAQEIISDIEEMEGVRHVLGLWEGTWEDENSGRK